MTSIHQPTDSMGVVSHTKHIDRHCTFDRGSAFGCTASLLLSPPLRQCRCVAPFNADTWLAGQLMATGSAALNNGRLRHNHPQRGEDSLWPHHLRFLIHKPSERWGERQRQTDTEKERERAGTIEQITVWTQRPKRDRGSDWGWG